jgi:hypothetical protein
MPLGIDPPLLTWSTYFQNGIHIPFMVTISYNLVQLQIANVDWRWVYLKICRITLMG